MNAKSRQFGEFHPTFRKSTDVPYTHDRAAVATGAIILKRGTFELSVEEIPSGMVPMTAQHLSQLGPFSAAIDRCDLVVITIDSATVDVKMPPKELMTTLADAVKLVRKTNANMMVSVAYTKADEFGTVDLGRIRVLEHAPQVVALDEISKARPCDVERRWKDFLNAVAPEEGDHKWNETKRVVLKQTRELWVSLVSTVEGGRPTLNGYFVSANPSDDYWGANTRPGVLDLFDDFFDFFQANTV
jgi:hypothetical protein